jgi:hypothetical protein
VEVKDLIEIVEQYGFWPEGAITEVMVYRQFIAVSDGLDVIEVIVVVYIQENGARHTLSRSSRNQDWIAHRTGQGILAEGVKDSD